MAFTDPNPALFDRAPHAVLLLNREGQVVHVNREACRMLAIAKERLLGRPVLALVAPSDRERVKALFRRVLGGQEREWTSRFNRGDSVTRVQWGRAIPVQRNGSVDGIVVFTRDVTESRSGRPETVQLQTLLENLTGQLVAVLDEDGRIRYSSGLSRTHYRDDVESVGTRFSELVQPDEENQRLFAELFHDVLQGRDAAGTHVHRRIDGTDFPVRTFASPYLDPRNGRVLGALIVGRDVTAEYDWRDRARRAQRLAGIGELTALVAARIRELTTGSDSEAPTADAAGRSDIDTVGATVAERLQEVGALTRALEDFAEGVQLERRPVSLPEEVRGVLTDMESTLAGAGIAATTQVPDTVPTVYADPGQIRRLVRILVDNAVEDGGEEGLHVSFSTLPEGVRMCVTDQGAVLDPDSVHRLFEPLFTTKPGHAGLGLTAARSIVLAHGGSIRAETGEAGSGLVVTVDLPFEDPDARVHFRPVPLELTKKRSVLVVDDEDGIRTAIRRFLEKVGFDVREAWSGRSAMAQITVSQPPEFVLTDLKMSDGSGSWFLNELSRDFPDLLRQTVIVTGNPDGAELDRLIRETGCPVLTKPLELPQLLDVLDEVAARG